jgi:hypothetical protein
MAPVGPVFRVVLAACFALAVFDSARGDGGRLQLRAVVGDHVLSVWTAPTPLRAGMVEVIVATEPASKGVAARAGEIAIEAWSAGRLVGRATVQAPGATTAPRRARLQLPEPGTVELRVLLSGDDASADLRTDVLVEPPLSPFAEHWFALVLPALAVALYALREWRRDVSLCPRDP